MADERIEIEIVLDDGSIQKGLAKIPQAAADAGKKAGDGLESGLSRGISNLIPSFSRLIGLATAAFGAISLKNAIADAIESENAINKLNIALANAGSFTEKASQDFQKFAETIQLTTRLTDEQALSLAALARNFAPTNEATLKLTQAAIDLSAATGKGLEESVDILGKTFSGTAGRLTAAIPQLKEFTAEQLKAGAAIDLVNQRFGGTAANEAKTFGGSLILLRNSFGELSESIGRFFTQSPTLIQIFNDIGSIFTSLVKKITDFQKFGDIFNPLLKTAIDFAGGFVAAVFPILETATTLFTGLGLAIIGVGQALTGNFSTAGETFRTSLEAFKDLGSTDVTDSILTSLTSVQDKYSSLATTTTTAADTLVNNNNRINESAKESANVFVVTSQQLAQSISKGVQQTITNLRNGQNGFKAFANATLGIIGGWAISIGETLIAIGIGIEKLKIALGTLTGGAAIAAGIALVAIGSLLQGLSGGGVTGGAVGGGSSAGSNAASTGFDQATQAPEVQEKSTKVQIDVQGTVLDPVGVGKQIAQILNDTFDATGTRVVTA